MKGIINSVIFALGLLSAYDLKAAINTIKNGFKCERLRKENELLKDRITLYEHMIK